MTTYFKISKYVAMCWNNDGAGDSGYTRKKKERPMTLPCDAHLGEPVLSPARGTSPGDWDPFPPQMDGPAVIVCGPTPERADLGHEVPGPPQRISAVKSWSSATRRLGTA